MKTLRIFTFSSLFLAIASFGFAQDTKTETLKVSGECGMCKKKIEKAAKEAGASYALWSTQTKVLTIRYNSLSTNSAKIQQNVANAGYDTPDYKATDEAYNKLDECCQYDRENAKTEKKEMDCCSSAKDKNTKCDMSKGDGCCKKDNKSNSAKKVQQ